VVALKSAFTERACRGDSTAHARDIDGADTDATGVLRGFHIASQGIESLRPERRSEGRG
jgi:hypothetical protein